MFLVRFLHRVIEGWRFVIVSGGITSSLTFSYFIFRVFMGLDIPLMRHIELTDEWMPWLGVICTAYIFIQQQSIAARPARRRSWSWEGARSWGIRAAAGAVQSPRRAWPFPARTGTPTPRAVTA